MRYIITTEQSIKEKGIEGYTYCSSLKDLAIMTTDGEICDGLIIHSVEDQFTDDYRVAIKDITNVTTIKRTADCKIFYINNNPLPRVRLMTQKHSLTPCTELTDEFYLEEKSELDALFEETFSLTEVDNSTDAMKAIMKVLESQGNNEPLQRYEIEQAVVALNELVNTVQTYKDCADGLIEISGKVMGYSDTVIKNICVIMKKQQEMQNKMQEKMKTLATPNLSSRDNMGVGSVQYPTVMLSPDVTTHTKILYVKEYSYCKYLATALLYYRRYLQTKCKLRAKIIYVIQKGQDLYAKYENAMPCISDTSGRNDPELFTTPTVAINNPTRVNVTNLLSGNNANLDIIIVVDRLYGAPIIQSNSVNFKSLSAIGNNSDFEIYSSRLRKDRTIISLCETQTGYFANLPRLKVQANDTRILQLYQAKTEENSEAFYYKLNDLLGLEVR